jgi:hypothetical protein
MEIRRSAIDVTHIRAALARTTGKEWLSPIGRIPQDDGLVCADDALNTIGEFKTVDDASFAIDAHNEYVPQLCDEVESLDRHVHEMSLDLDVAHARAEAAEKKLDLIHEINEDDWEDGTAASWVEKIMCGEPLDSMVTQEQLEDRYGSAERAVPVVLRTPHEPHTDGCPATGVSQSTTACAVWCQRRGHGVGS